MLRTQFVKLARASPLQATHQFSVLAARAAEGETRGSGGSVGGDAFQKREQAQEGAYIREKELETLKNLKEKLAAQKKHLEELDGHIAELEKGGKK